MCSIAAGVWIITNGKLEEGTTAIVDGISLFSFAKDYDTTGIGTGATKLWNTKTTNRYAVPGENINLIFENDVPVETVVIETENYVYLNDGKIEVEEIRYKLAGYELKQFPASEVFASAAALKTNFESMVDGL